MEQEAVETGPIPLIKAAVAFDATPSSGHSAPAGCIQKQGTSNDFAGRCILCVGGRAALYPEYKRVVEASGGKLMFYRNPPQ
ncbi:MAG TPA: hypothetical protein VJ734_05460, partial [Nitrosospira sp.]|nr:hypothetical protein [Nitrosospira sp.]